MVPDSVFTIGRQMTSPARSMTVAGEVDGSRRNEMGWSWAGPGEAPGDSCGEPLCPGPPGAGVRLGLGDLSGFDDRVAVGLALGDATGSPGPSGDLGGPPAGGSTRAGGDAA